LAETVANENGEYVLSVKPLKLRQTVEVVSEKDGQTKSEMKVVGAGHVGEPALR
jgi:2',3'-cyclic-nucleotide 2'-phosphodiesterase/3'-nucleotidase